MSIVASNRKTLRSQRGSVVIHVAIFLSLAVILFVGTELGYLFYLKREFQKSADLAALAGAQALDANNCTTAYGAAKSNANDSSSRNMPADFSLKESDMACGQWNAQDTTNANHFNEASTEKNAIRVNITRTPPPLFIFFTGNRTISVEAIAARALPKAALSINSTLLSLKTGQSKILDALVGGLLGGSIELGAVGWEGLVTSKISLLSFLDALAPTINLAVGDYDGILNANVTVAQLLEAMAAVLQQNGALLSAELGEYRRLAVLAAALKLPPIKVGDALGVITGTATSALDLSLQAAHLTQAFVQLANSQVADPSAVLADVALPIAGVTATVKIIEPPQFSAIGNPELAKAAPLGPDKIYVRTSQIRTFVTVDLDAGSITGLTSSLLELLSSAVISVLQFIIDLAPPKDCPPISLNCQTSPKPTVLNVKPLSSRIDIVLDVAPASANVTDYDCSNPLNKELSVHARSNIAELRIGKMGETRNDAKEKVFSSVELHPAVQPVPLLDIGTIQTRKTCAVVVLVALCTSEYQTADGDWTIKKSSAKRTAFGGGGVGFAINPTGEDEHDGGPGNLSFESAELGLLKELNDTSAPAQKYLSTSATPNVAGLILDTINGLELKLYPPGTSTGSLGEALGTVVNSTVLTVLDVLKKAVAPLLASIINPLVQLLLTSLGIDLTNAQVGARLSCRAGAELVH